LIGREREALEVQMNADLPAPDFEKFYPGIEGARCRCRAKIPHLPLLWTTLVLGTVSTDSLGF
jgi:hypothetical protein